MKTLLLEYNKSLKVLNLVEPFRNFLLDLQLFYISSLICWKVYRHFSEDFLNVFWNDSL